MSLGDPRSLNRYSYVGGEPTNFIDPSGLIISNGPGPGLGFGDLCFFFGWCGGGHIPPLTDRGGGGGDGDNTGKPPILRLKHCKQGINGKDITAIKQYLRHYGLDKFIDVNTIKMDPVHTEGITFAFTNAAGAADYLRDKSNGFGIGGFFSNLFEQHNRSVSGGKVSLEARGIQDKEKGPLPDRSLQFDIGSPVKNSPNARITGYADLDCYNPLQYPVQHILKL